MELADLKPLLLVQDGNTVLKVSTVYDTYVTAELVYPIPQRTTVRTYLPEEVRTWRTPTSYMMARYTKAWDR